MQRPWIAFEDGGARVDRATKIVKIPPYLVEEAIRSAPSKVILAGRDPQHDIVLESTRVHFTNFSEGVKINDPFTGENREPVKQDLVDTARVIDYLAGSGFLRKSHRRPRCQPGRRCPCTMPRRS